MAIAPPVPARSRLMPWLVLVGLMVAVWTGLAVDARASYGARTTADEPHYLLTAISLWQDRDITTGDELRERAYAPFHEVELLDQTTPLPDGRQVEPHDPLLPVLLALPTGLGGWVAAKLTLAALAGVLAVVTAWVAIRRFAVPTVVAVVTVLAFSLAMPLSAYATQVYPELPAALAVALAVGALTGPFGRRGVALWVTTLVALPWLSVKYAPVVVVLAAIGLALLWRGQAWRRLVLSGALLAVAGVTYLVAHQVLYGGWTVYASGDHFAEGGQLSVMGYEANYPGRTIRLLGLLVDRNFGLLAWAPVYLLMVPAIVASVRSRARGWPMLVLPLAAAWANATWIAQTMQGWWSPGRQLVVALPTVVIATAWFAARLRHGSAVVAVLGAVGVVNWMWSVVEASSGRRTLVVDFMLTSNPLYRVWASSMPNGMTQGAHDAIGYLAWGVVLAGLARWGWRVGRPNLAPSPKHIVVKGREATCSRESLVSVS